MLLKPGVENQEYWFMFDGIDKVIHLSIFAFLGFSFIVVFPKIKFLNYLYIILIYAFLTEILQDEMHMGRSAEFFDIVADFLGFLLGYFTYIIIKKRLR